MKIYFCNVIDLRKENVKGVSIKNLLQKIKHGMNPIKHPKIGGF